MIHIWHIFCRSFCIFVQCFHRKAKQFFRSAPPVWSAKSSLDPIQPEEVHCAQLIVTLSTDQDTFLHYHCITTLQYYYITTLLHYYITTLLHYYITTLQNYYITTLQNYYITTLQNYYIVALLQLYFYITTLLFAEIYQYIY